MKAASFGALCALAFFVSVATAQNVKVTPLGSHDGELCANDRATLFEDPTGVRILYDVGNTLSGADDPRLGTVHVVLLSHAHGDHIGDRKLKALNAGSCAAPESMPASPNGMTAEVAAARPAPEPAPEPAPALIPVLLPAPQVAAGPDRDGRRPRSHPLGERRHHLRGERAPAEPRGDREIGRAHV